MEAARLVSTLPRIASTVGLAASTDFCVLCTGVHVLRTKMLGARVLPIRFGEMINLIEIMVTWGCRSYRCPLIVVRLSSRRM